MSEAHRISLTDEQDDLTDELLALLEEKNATLEDGLVAALTVALTGLLALIHRTHERWAERFGWPEGVEEMVEHLASFIRHAPSVRGDPVTGAIVAAITTVLLVHRLNRVIDLSDLKETRN